jgi:4-hydroxybenzoate polyprenyltransferase
MLTSLAVLGTSPIEDAQNKPYRPIPSKRISLANAKTLRYTLPALNVLFSSTIGALPGSLGISLFTPIHNELGGSNFWLTKNACTAMLYAFFETGATMIAGGFRFIQISHHPPDTPFFSDGSTSLTTPQVAAVIGSACIIFTTIQAQDFCDVEGDAAQGRNTFPMMYPAVSRATMPIGLIAWSLLLVYLSEVHAIFLCALLVIATWVGMRFTFLTTPKEDKASYLYYNVSRHDFP